MKSIYSIIWTREAVRNLDEITEYLLEFWSERELKIFLDNLEKLLTLISQSPTLFPASNKGNSLRRAVLSKQTTVFYSFDSDEITLISLFNNRRDPNSLDI